MLAVLLSPFLVAAAAPWLPRRLGRATGWLLTLVPLGLTAYLGSQVPRVAVGEPLAITLPWVPALGLALALRLDGLSLLLALLIAGIGALVVGYSGSYLAGHPHAGRFLGWLFAFMGAMLGVVLADNLLLLYVFWELTTIASYFLIGFEDERPEAREGAWQALLVATTGGFALLVAVLLLGAVAGTYEISALASGSQLIQADPRYPAILALVLIGAFTKSAQTPFHFWLPSAMEAPTPVSAYLHSATMVKAGVYLLARLTPALGGTEAWYATVVTVGAVTMVVGAWLAVVQLDLKRLLAYSTVSSLGMMTLLIGLGTLTALKAALVFLLAHALYKGALFLVVGAVDHETGIRRLDHLGGLGRAMPVTAAAGAGAALAMAGVPPFLGFIAKDGLYESALHAPAGAAMLVVAAVGASVLYVAAALMAGIAPFAGRRTANTPEAREAPISLWLAPAVLVVSALLTGACAGAVGDRLIGPAATAALGRPVPAGVELWPGVTPALVMGLLTVALGAGAFVGRRHLRRLAPGPRLAAWGPGGWYEAALDRLMAVAGAQTRLIQNGFLRYYLLTVVLAGTALVAFTAGAREGLPAVSGSSPVLIHEVALAVLIAAAALVAVRALSRVQVVAALGTVAFGIALIFVLFGAPDLAITLVLVDTLTVILFVLVLARLPRFSSFLREPGRLRDGAVAVAVGGLMTLLVYTATSVELAPPISGYFAEHSVPGGHGRNVVNVILVDFRALDTLGEITVLAVAGAGVYALLRLRPSRGGDA